MADDDFSIPVPASGTVSRLVRRTVQLGVDPESLESSLNASVRAFYSLDDDWHVFSEVIKKIRQDGGAGTYVVWYRVTISTEFSAPGVPVEELGMLIGENATIGDDADGAVLAESNESLAAVVNAPS